MAFWRPIVVCDSVESAQAQNARFVAMSCINDVRSRSPFTPDRLCPHSALLSTILFIALEVWAGMRGVCEDEDEKTSRSRRAAVYGRLLSRLI